MHIDTDGAATNPRRLLWRRTLWHSIGLAVVIALAWLILRAYQQPEFLIELSNLMLC